MNESLAVFMALLRGSIMSESNRQAAITFLNLVVAGKISEAYETHVSPQMRHHNSFFAGDVASLQRGMEENHREHPNKIFDVQRTLAEAEFIAVHSRIRMSADDNGMAVIHLFRFHDDEIVEMWSVGQQVSEDSTNENGMF